MVRRLRSRVGSPDRGPRAFTVVGCELAVVTAHVLRGRADTVAADREASRRLLEVAAAGERAVRVWTPHRQVAFGRRDANRDGYDRARQAAQAHDFEPVERSVGGRAVAYDGETTLAFARAEPVGDLRSGIQDRYDALADELATALADLDVSVERGEPADAFCPGSHSLRLPDGPKVAGIAQRVTDDAALVAGILVVDGRAELAAVLADVYAALDLSLDGEAVGSVVDGDGSAGPERVRRTVESQLVGDETPTYVHLND